MQVQFMGRAVEIEERKPKKKQVGASFSEEGMNSSNLVQVHKKNSITGLPAQRARDLLASIIS